MQQDDQITRKTASWRPWMTASLAALSMLVALAFAISVGAQAVNDTDADGVPDDMDNCINVPNGPGSGPCPSQIDRDVDGYGDACDHDFNQNFVSDITDCSAGVAAFQAVPGDAEWRDDYDLNCNGLIDINDVSEIVGAFQSPVGPSGLACAGTVPCP